MTKYIYEEKTAPSGSIAHITDGADAVPLKSWEVTLPASLSGYSEVNGTQTGDSVFLPMDIEQGTISGSGYNSNSTARIRTINRNAVKPSTEYKIKVNSEVQIYEVHEYTDLTGSSTHLTVNANEYTFTTKSTTNYLRILFRYSNNATITPSAITSLQVTDGNLFWQVFTASLGRTIYGGQADIVNGTAEPTNYLGTSEAETKTHNSVSITCDGNGKYTATGTATGGSANITFNLQTPSEIKSGMYLHLMNTAANASVAVTLQRQDNTTIFAPALSPANRIIDLTSYVGETIYSLRFYVANGAAFSMDISPMLCYSSAVTPYSPYFAPFTFTPITPTPETALGTNNFWANEGDTEVTYYIQIPVEEKYIIGGEILSDIADAIREKKETASPILTEDMADEIRSIEMGGSDLLDLASQSTFDFTDDTYKTNALTIPDRMFNNNQRIRTVNISGIKTVESYAFIQCKATSLSFPDVETIGYQAFFQCRGASDVPLSIPNVVTIGEEAFKEAYVCGESPSYRFLDISKCVTIGNNAFRSTRINGFKMDSVETLGNMPWYGSWFSMTTVVFPKLKTAHDQMCRGMNFTNLVIGPDWESCGGGFAGYDMDWRNKYVYVYAVVPPTMGGDFSLWKPPVAFYVPADSVDAYKAAPYWSQYASIILPLPSDHLTIDTWL